jgi:hypothetical protein
VNGLLPPNSELYQRTLHPSPEKGRFDELLAFAREHQLVESEPELQTRLQSSFHEVFWEFQLCRTLYRSGLELRRERGPIPDFSNRVGDTTVFWEAIACGEPSDKNRIPPLDSSDDFEAGNIETVKSQHRLASALDAKIKAVTRPDAEMAMLQRVQGSPFAIVIAINGRRSHASFAGVPGQHPPIYQTLFGEIELRVDSNGLHYHQADRTPRNAPVGHFCRATWRSEHCISRIAGVLYSDVSLLDQPSDSDRINDFIYVQNPYGPNLAEKLKNCVREVWIRLEQAPNVYRASKL